MFPDYLSISYDYEQGKFTYTPLEKDFEKQKQKVKTQGEKQIKTIEDQGEKQVKALENQVEKNFLDTDQKSIASLFSKKNSK